MYRLFRLYKKPRVIIHANLAVSLLIGQLIFVSGVDTTPKVCGIYWNLKCIAVVIVKSFLIYFNKIT